LAAFVLDDVGHLDAMDSGNSVRFAEWIVDPLLEATTRIAAGRLRVLGHDVLFFGCSLI
jgi:hypothetical protein